jgi:hypothetical protein
MFRCAAAVAEAAFGAVCERPLSVAAAWAAAALDTARKRRRDHSLLNFIVLTFAV